MPDDSLEITRLLGRVSDGDAEAAEEILPLLYAELHRMARGEMRHQRANHTLGATGLVSEAYLKLFGGRRNDFRDRDHFLALASRAMRQVLVDHARGRNRDKRRPRGRAVPLDDLVDSYEASAEDLLSLNEALDRLGQVDEQMVRVVELRFFGGLAMADVARILDLSKRHRGARMAGCPGLAEEDSGTAGLRLGRPGRRAPLGNRFPGPKTEPRRHPGGAGTFWGRASRPAALNSRTASMEPRSALLSLSLGAALLAGLRPPAQSAVLPVLQQDRITLDRARALAQLADSLVGAGEGFQAVALVQAELSPDNPPAVEAVLRATLGSIEHRLADQNPDQRGRHLEASLEHHRAAAELQPQEPSYGADAALVQGDLLADRADLSGALGAWWRALDLEAGDETPGRRILTALDGNASALAVEAQTFEERGLLGLARDGWRASLAATPPEAAADPLLRWLLLDTQLGDFSAERLAQLEGGGAALAELRLLVARPEGAPIPSWAASPLSRHAIAATLRSLGGRRALAGDGAGALACYDRALAVAPDPPVQGRPPVRLHVMLDAAMRLHAEPLLDPDGSRAQALSSLLLGSDSSALIGDMAGRQRYYQVLGQILAERGQWTTPLPNNALHFLKLSITLRRELDGTTFDDVHPLPHISQLMATGYVHVGEPRRALGAYMDAAQGYLDLGSNASAEEALTEARLLAASLGPSMRLASLEERLAAATGRRPPVDDIAAADPAQPPAPVDTDPTPAPSDPIPAGPSPSDPQALEAGFNARREDDGILVALLALDVDRLTGPLQRDAWGAASWYAGGGLGPVWLRNSEGELEDDLAAFAVVADLDRSDLGWRVYGGYRFDGPLALEIGYTDLGTLDSTLGPVPTTGVGAFLDAIDDDHPATGHGPTAGLRLLLWSNDSLAAAAKVGLWAWEADLDVSLPASRVSLDRDGVDLYYGVDLAWYPSDWGALRLDYERYVLDDTEADLLTFGIELQLDHLLLDRILGRRRDNSDHFIAGIR